MTEMKSEHGAPPEPRCPRCGDVFYDPKTLIADAKQHAAEWEEVAKRAEKERDEYKQKFEKETLVSWSKAQERDEFKKAWETSAYNMNLVTEISSLKAEIEKLLRESGD